MHKNIFRLQRLSVRALEHSKRVANALGTFMNVLQYQRFLKYHERSQLAAWPKRTHVT